MSAAKASQQRWSVFSETWRTRLWPLPVLGVLAAVALGVGLPRFDAQTHDELPAGVTAYLFSGGPEAARAVLSAVAGSLITVTSLIFSLTVVTLQLASSQYSPRLLRTFMGDQLVHATLALLLATFTYSVTVLRTVRASLDDQAAFVPQLSVTTAYLLAMASVIMLVVFLAHLARKIRVESVLRDVHTETAATMRRVLEEEGATGVTEVPAIPATGVILLYARSSGFLTSVDEQALLAAAVDADAVVVLDRVPGDSLIADTPIAAAWAFGDDTALHPEIAITLVERAAAAVRTGFERTAAQDLAFGLRQLVDVTVKALSPGINDPTTAVHALSHAAALLCEAANRDLGPRLLRDDTGQVRVVLRRPDFPTLLELVMAQPCRYGAADPDVLARLLMLLREVAWSTRRPEHHQAVNEQLLRLCAVVDRQDYDHIERARLDDATSSVRQALAGRWPLNGSG